MFLPSALLKHSIKLWCCSSVAMVEPLYWCLFTFFKLQLLPQKSSQLHEIGLKRISKFAKQPHETKLYVNWNKNSKYHIKSPGIESSDQRPPTPHPIETKPCIKMGKLLCKYTITKDDATQMSLVRCWIQSFRIMWQSKFKQNVQFKFCILSPPKNNPEFALKIHLKHFFDVLMVCFRKPTVGLLENAYLTQFPSILSAFDLATNPPLKLSGWCG